MGSNEGTGEPEPERLHVRAALHVHRSIAFAATSISIAYTARLDAWPGMCKRPWTCTPYCMYTPCVVMPPLPWMCNHPWMCKCPMCRVIKCIAAQAVGMGRQCEYVSVRLGNME